MIWAFLTRRRIYSLLMIQEVLEEEDSLQVSSARRLVNISGMVRAIDLKCLQVRDMVFMFEWKSLQQYHHYHGGRNWN
jgi:hypothetical protein